MKNASATTQTRVHLDRTFSEGELIVAEYTAMDSDFNEMGIYIRQTTGTDGLPRTEVSFSVSYHREGDRYPRGGELDMTAQLGGDGVMWNQAEENMFAWLRENPLPALSEFRFDYEDGFQPGAPEPVTSTVQDHDGMDDWGQDWDVPSEWRIARAQERGWKEAEARGEFSEEEDDYSPMRNPEAAMEEAFDEARGLLLD